MSLTKGLDVGKAYNDHMARDQSRYGYEPEFVICLLTGWLRESHF